uniref:Uncharacterized protein n=1 Tax=Arundo donax TaxID=35708 RepID=A0A0A9AHC7_ARUDO
MSGLQASSS